LFIPLRCRSIAVEHRFTDEQVLADDFLEQVIKKMEITAPFVQLLNEVSREVQTQAACFADSCLIIIAQFISPSPPSDDEDGGDDGASGSGGGDEEEEEEE